MAALIVAGIAGVAPAAATCTSPKDSYQVGAVITGHSQQGVEADIPTDNPNLCDSTSASFAWVGESDSSCSYCIVQIGYSHFGTTPGQPYKDLGAVGFHVFDEKRKCDNINICPLHMNFWAAPSGTNTYKVGYDDTNHRFNLWKNTTQMDTTTWDPKVEWGDPGQGQYWTLGVIGETWHCQSDVPAVTFSTIRREAADGTWGSSTNLTQAGGLTCARYGFNGSGLPDSFSISNS